jgi:ribonuclease HI
LKFGNALNIKKVIWQPPIFNWIKCNCDRASLENTGNSACGGIFRNVDSSFLGVNALNIGVSTFLIGVMIAIEIAANEGWSHLWLEFDSMLVVLAFSSTRIVPWPLRNRWDNCLMMISNMNLYVSDSHIYREGNHCANKLANLNLSLPTFAWWDHIPSYIVR